MTQIKALQDILLKGEITPENHWELRVIQSENCQSYVAWNTNTREAIIVDPKDTDDHAYHSIVATLPNYLWLAIIDTHTHADHISIASKLAKDLKAPLLMHERSPSRRVDIRVSRETEIPTHAGPLKIFLTPGHTQDSITVLWGPYLFGGDTVLYGDVGRDDLPGGDAGAHFDSVNHLKECILPNAIVLPGHDPKDGRASSWATQLKINSSLTQSRQEFIAEAEAFNAPAPKLLKESLKENFK